MILLKSLLVENMTDTPEFKRWFGNSKIVDKHGNPLVVYHGTDADFQKFSNEATGGVGHYFTSDPEEASVYAGFRGNDTNQNIIPAFLRIENPATSEIEESIAHELKGQLGGNPRMRINRVLMNRGYDGIVRGTHIIVFHPNQIKSAIGNRGSFNTNDPDITKESN